MATNHPQQFDESQSAPSRAPDEEHQSPTQSLPLVSVIMPAFNSARYIQESIDSVLAQDYPNNELIVIDDGSTDSTVELVSDYGNRVRLITQQNQGAAVARNAGLKAARGDYIAFIDSDDVWLPGKLTTQIRHLQHHPDVGIVYARWHKWKPDNSGEFPPPATFNVSGADTHDSDPGITQDGSGWLYTRLLFTSKLHTITVVARRSVVEVVGDFDTTLKRGQDYDYWIRASRETRIHQLDQPLALYRLHDDGCMTKYPNVNYEFLVVQKALDKWGRIGPDGSTTSRGAIRRRLGETCFSFGYFHYWEGTPRIAMRAFAHAVIRQPLHLSSWAYLALSSVKAIREAGALRGT